MIAKLFIGNITESSIVNRNAGLEQNLHYDIAFMRSSPNRHLAYMGRYLDLFRCHIGGDNSVVFEFEIEA